MNPGECTGLSLISPFKWAGKVAQWQKSFQSLGGPEFKHPMLNVNTTSWGAVLKSCPCPMPSLWRSASQTIDKQRYPRRSSGKYFYDLHIFLLIRNHRSASKTRIYQNEADLLNITHADSLLLGSFIKSNVLYIFFSFDFLVVLHKIIMNNWPSFLMVVFKKGSNKYLLVCVCVVLCTVWMCYAVTTLS